jgi:hypothetical protein
MIVKETGFSLNKKRRLKIRLEQNLLCLFSDDVVLEIVYSGYGCVLLYAHTDRKSCF